jgi:hypothetical protein
MMRESPSMPLNHSDSTPLRGQKSDPTTAVLEINVSGCTTSRPTELLTNHDAGEHDISQWLALMLTMSPTSKSLSALKIKFIDKSLSILWQLIDQKKISQIKIMVFTDETSYSLVNRYQCFRWTCCLRQHFMSYIAAASRFL